MIFLIFLFIGSALIYPSNLSENFEIKLKVVYLEDKRLPSITQKDIKEILEEAKNELQIKFGINYVNFDYSGIKPISIFFNKNLNKNDKYYKNLSLTRYKLFSNEISYEGKKEEILKFLKQWKLWDIKKFFSEDVQKNLNNYEDVMKELYKIYFEKLKILENLKLSNGKFLIDRENNDFNSYINWVVAMNNQDEYDILFTNTIIVYDDILHPYPHAVLRYAKVGGSSFDSPKRMVFYGRAAMVNLFEMLTDIDYFKKDESEKNIDRSLWNKIIGSFILAHEIGHALFLIPDVYDHPKQCLMDSSYETMNYYEGYKILKQYPFSCLKCEVYINARENFFLAENFFKNNNYEEAINYYRLSAKMTPEKLDVDYNSYISDIYYKIGNCFFLLNDYNNARSYLEKSLNYNPENKLSKNLLNKLE